MGEGHAVDWRMYSERGVGGWQAGYAGHYVRAQTKDAAALALLRELREHGVEPPEELSRYEDRRGHPDDPY